MDISAARISASLERRRNDIVNADDLTVKYTIVEGEVPVSNVGESTVDINFPCLFAEKPLFTCGHEIDSSQSLVVGHFPTWSASVYEWILVKRDTNKIYYSGAKVAITVNGSDGLKSIIHCAFHGEGFVNPSISPQGVNSPL